MTQQLAAAAKQSYSDLLKRHIKDHSSLFGRLELDAGSTPEERRNLPTDVRLGKYKSDGNDIDLEELVFQYGRYLLIACSRPGTLPANLQGLWNHKNNAPWHSDYHSNINIQMNYWLAKP